VQKRKLIVSPIIMSLKKIDFWSWCRYFIDIYRECPFKCSYCNTKRQYDMKGLDFIHGLPERRETVGLGLLSDIYHPVPHTNEETITNILEILYSRGYSVNILTKSDQVLQNLELLRLFSKKNRARVTLTLLTTRSSLCTKLEGRAPCPADRLRVLERLTEQGIPTGIAITPIIPLINDDKTMLTRLVQEGKTRGAGWVIFSGFNPTTSFLNNPLWKQTALLHTDPVKLSEQYSSIKQFMIKLLFRENLSMRIPRMNGGPLDTHYSSHIVSEHLFTISYLYELMENQLETMRYRRAAYELDGLEKSLKSIVSRKKHGYIKGINPEIETVIEEFLYSGKSAIYSHLFHNMTAEG